MTGFERWKQSNPGGTLEQYEKALQKFNKNKKVSLPTKLRYDPSGVVIPVGAFSPIELSEMTRDFVNSGQQQQ